MTKTCPICRVRGRVGKKWATIVVTDHAPYGTTKTYTMHKDCMSEFLTFLAAMVDDNA